MLNLTLRQEFRGINMPGTVIALHKDNSQGATDISTSDFLKITYPTSDVIKAIKIVKIARVILCINTIHKKYMNKYTYRCMSPFEVSFF